jgi:hypothetical protein
VDDQCHVWITYPEIDEGAYDIKEDIEQAGMEVKIGLPMSRNFFTTVEELKQ